MASIRKRNNTYQITVSKGYDSTGKKLFETATFVPDPKKTERQNKKALEMFTFEFEQKVLSGNYLDGEKMTLKEFSEKWLNEHVKPTLNATTYENYKMNLESRILPALGHMKMAKIKPLNIQEFYNTLAAEGIRNDKKEGALSLSTIKKYHAILSSMFHTAVIWQIIVANPCDRVKPPSDNHAYENKAKHFTLEQADIFLKALDMDIVTDYSQRVRTDKHGNPIAIQGYQTTHKMPYQFKVFFYLALFGGFRRGEILALKWKDIDFEKQTVSISKSLTTENHQLVLKFPKSKTSVRCISIPVTIINMLRQLKKEQQQYSFSIGTQWLGFWGNEYDENFLFIQWNGLVMHLDSPYKWFRKIIKYHNAQCNEKERLPEIPMHGLRHTSATLLISQNIDIRTVSGRLGHAQTSTTMNIYAHSLQKMDQIAADALEELFINSSSQESASSK